MSDNPPTPAPQPEPTGIPEFGMTQFEAVGQLLNRFTSVELKIFGEKYGFEIRHALTKLPKYKDMTASEKESFDRYHDLNRVR